MYVAGKRSQPIRGSLFLCPPLSAAGKFRRWNEYFVKLTSRPAEEPADLRDAGTAKKCEFLGKTRLIQDYSPRLANNIRSSISSGTPYALPPHRPCSTQLVLKLARNKFQGQERINREHDATVNLRPCRPRRLHEPESGRSQFFTAHKGPDRQTRTAGRALFYCAAM